MSKHLIDIDFSVGIPEIDNAHAIIRETADEFLALLSGSAECGLIVAKFLRLRDLIVGHFLMEERLFPRIATVPGGQAHVDRHLRNHQAIRDAFVYAADRVATAKSIDDLPNILGLIPQKYMGEMVSVDREMADLLGLIHDD